MSEFVYLILGCRDSGRRYVIHDLIRDLASESDPFTLLLPQDDAPNEWSKKLETLPNVTIKYYSKHVSDISADQFNPQHTNIILTSGLVNPVDQVEDLKPLIEASSCELGRIITVVNCAQLEAHHELLAWYDACLHFSDACLIQRGPNTSNQFVQDFLDRYKHHHIPCYFESFGKKGIKNPELVLEPQARRISLYFEPSEDRWLDDEDEAEFEEEAVDPYLARHPSGIRKKWLPDLESILKKQ